MRKSELMRRYLVFSTALFFSALGVSLVTRFYLGTSPISSLPFVMSINTPISMGSYIFLLNMVLIAIQLILLGKHIKQHRIELLLQIPISVAFGGFVDLTMALLSFYNPHFMVTRIGTVLLGCVIMAFGIALQVIANVTMVSGEYTVRIASERWGMAFGNVKISFDVLLVVCAVLCSLLFTGHIQGIGIGTLIVALLTGPFVKKISPYLSFVERWESENRVKDLASE